MPKEQFFEKLFINAELADNICRDLNIGRKQYSDFTILLNKERAEEIKSIKRIRNLYHNKGKLPEFLGGFNEFYKWHRLQYEKQEGKCYYCGTDEKVIATLFEKKFLHRKRTTRGKHLEIERRDAISNGYNKENCVLACYFCNNDKSDIFSETEYLEFLKNRKEFLTNEYNKLND